MAKSNFLEWDPIANNNTDVGGVDISEGCAPSNLNDAERTIMAQLRSGVDGKVIYALKTSTYTAVGNDNNAIHRCTVAVTINLTLAATLGANWHMMLIADGGDITVTPTSPELINGASSLTIKTGESAIIVCDGTAFSLIWVSNAATVINCNTGLTPIADGLTRYIGPAGQSASETDAEFAMPFGGVFVAMYAVASGAGAGTRTYRLRKAGANTDITCSSTGGSRAANDTSHSASFAAGDLVCVKVDTSGGATTAGHNVTLLALRTA